MRVESTIAIDWAGGRLVNGGHVVINDPLFCRRLDSTLVQWDRLFYHAHTRAGH